MDVRRQRLREPVADPRLLHVPGTGDAQQLLRRDRAHPVALRLVGQVAEPEREKQQERTAEQVVVQLSVPPTASPGEYSFRLDAVSAVDPDEDFTEGPSVAFDVEAAPPPPKKFPWVPWWIIAVAGGVLLLIIIAVVVFLLVRNSGSRAISSGNGTIPTNQVFDVDTGKVSAGGRGADVEWHMVAFNWTMAGLLVLSLIPVVID